MYQNNFFYFLLASLFVVFVEKYCACKCKGLFLYSHPSPPDFVLSLAVEGRNKVLLFLSWQIHLDGSYMYFT